ncbi:hypothetical protein [Citrifermentans bemidjiense]|jgi:hypothetical protein|nr:hypothetical protein [Citrifermentans bemidjiense]
MFYIKVSVMRVFYFSPESGVYQGEGFLDERDLERVEALTPIAPPRYAKGEVPVFNATTQSWMLLKVPQKPHLSQ